jgi:hypothetical protein
VKRIIKSLKRKNSSGYENIPVRILRMSVSFILSPLTYICNITLSTGKFPDRLKHAIVRQLYKKGSKVIISNYRPISILTSFSKIFEKLIFIRLCDHISTNTLITKEQHGFRSTTSTQTPSYALLNEILKGMDNSCIVGGIFYDLEKAFDCVNHKILLKELEIYEITGKFHTLIASYLSVRYQKLVLEDISSDWELNKYGVPQGSILGPLLFLLYINDLPNVLPKMATILYADDTSIIINNKNPDDLKTIMNNTYQDLNNWFKQNLLSLKHKKTHFLHFKIKNTNHIDINTDHINEPISKVQHIRFLGLMLDDTFSWKSHIDHLVCKLSPACFAIRTLQSVVSEATLSAVYFSYIHSILSYDIIFWANCSESNKIFKLQKRAIRIITRSKNKALCRELFKKLNILPLYSLYMLSISIHVAQNKHLYVTSQEIHNIDTRYKTNFHPPISNTTNYQKGPYYFRDKIF